MRENTREAEVCSHCGTDKRDMARLIAAAPELLEALEDYVDADTIAIGHGYGVGGEARDKALAAIAKAKGETNE